MYVSKYVDIPNEILTAIQENKLVVFAGAGVSIPEPARYPDFKKLADDIGKGSIPREADQSIDYYLGQLKNVGVDVHGRTKRILSDVTSKPTSLHKALVDLFKESKHLRIVTTNFDTHFSTVINERFNGQVESYYAPALPLGGDFQGLVYLHGSVERDSRTLVLTDGDFGQAYLTSGWATRFLYEMFANYTVLFVGYSHEDPIIRYLGRGLALHQKTNRYALTKDGRNEFWKSFGITPLSFPDYEDLPVALNGLVNLINMGVLDHDDRIKKIVSSAPPMDPETLDYLDNVLNNPIWIRSFRHHAKDIEWLEWIADKPQIRLLFTPGSQCLDTLEELAIWIADSFVLSHTDEMLTILRRYNQVLHPVLWNNIARKLWVDQNADESIIKKWVALLIGSYTSGCITNYLEYLLEKYKNQNDCYLVISIFDFLTRPKLSLVPNYGASFYKEEDNPPKTLGKVEVLGDGFHLNEAWSKGIKNNLDTYAVILEASITSNISRAFILLTDFKDFNSYDEPVIAGRRNLTPPEEDYHPKGIDVLIDAARDTIEWLILNRPLDGILVVAKWKNSNVPILIRLSIYGMSSAKHISSDEKILWLIDNKLLFNPLAKTETVCLLKSTYVEASDKTKEKLIHEIATENLRIYYPWVDDEAVLERERFTWLSTLDSWELDYPYVKQHLLAMSSVNPELKSGRLLDTKITRPKATFRTFESPVTKDELISKKPEEVVDFLITFEGDIFNGPSRIGLVACVAEVVASNYRWGIQSSKLLFEREAWTSDLWDGIYSGWDKTELSAEQWQEVLTLTKEHKVPIHIAKNVADLFFSAIQRETGGLPPSCFIFAEEIAKHLLREHFLACEEVEDGGEWLNKAISHSGGKLTEFVLHSLSKTRRSLENWDGLTDHYKEYFDLLLNKDCYAAQMGRVILAANVLFLFNTDKEWSLNNVLPLFQWTEEKKAQQAWDGFLHWGKWDDGLLGYMLPMFEASFDKLNNQLLSLKDRFCEYLAGFAVYSSVDPVHDGWLFRFLLATDIEGRVFIAKHIADYFHQMNDEAIGVVWGRWLRDYLASRLEGVPIALAVEEVEAMISWAPSLDEQFPEFVDLICQMTVPSVNDTTPYWRINERGLAKKHPKDVARLLAHLLQVAKEPFYPRDIVVDIVNDLITAFAPIDVLRSIIDQLARLGLENATEIRDKINY